MKKQEIKTLAPLFDNICKINKFYNWKLKITYTPKQVSAKTSIVITENKDMFSGCILKKIINLKEMQKWDVSFYIKTRNNKMSLRIFL